MGWHQVLKLGLDWRMTFLMTQNFAKISKFGRFFIQPISRFWKTATKFMTWLNALLKPSTLSSRTLPASIRCWLVIVWVGWLGGCWYRMMTWRPKSNRWLPITHSWIIFQQAMPHLSVMHKTKRSVTALNFKPCRKSIARFLSLRHFAVPIMPIAGLLAVCAVSSRYRQDLSAPCMAI